MTASYQPRSKIEDREDALVISIPTPKNWFTMLFLPVWLIGWVFGLVMVWQSFFRGALGFVWVFTIAWLTFWIIGGLFAIFVLFRMFFGHEILTIVASEFQIRNNIFGFGKSQYYDRNHVTGLRLSLTEVSMFSFGGNMAWYGFLPGSIAFDYGARTIRFAAGLDEAEARALVERINERFPEVVSNAKVNSRFVPR